MKILNLYAGLGGNRQLWPKWCEVTAVENHPKIAEIYQRQFPNDILIIGDAHQYLLDHHKEFDFIWSSRPCQSHSKMNKFTRHNIVRYIDGGLFEEIIFLKHYFGDDKTKGFVFENVIPYYEILMNPTKIGRHLFWTNFPVSPIEVKQPSNFINLADLKGKKQMMEWLNIHYDENIYYGGNHCPVQILRNCVHPKVGESIFNDYCKWLNKDYDRELNLSQILLFKD
jgi:DNA (cytosine-5)-methyltransferase 1